MINLKTIRIFLRHVHLGFYNRLYTFIPSFVVRHLILRYLYGVKIGKCSTIEMGVRFMSPQKIRLGDYSVVHYDSILDGRMGLEIGDCVDIGHQVNIFTLQHDMDDPGYVATGGPVRIGKHAVVGGRSTILPSVSIGEGAVVASGAVVTKDIGSFEMVGGVPAKFIRKRAENLKYKITYRAWFQ